MHNLLRLPAAAVAKLWVGDQWRLWLCVCVRALKGRRLELSTRKLIQT